MALGGPLQGVRVVELAQGWAAPLCGKLLADLGADVVKAELPDVLFEQGVTLRQRQASYVLANAGKRLLRGGDRKPQTLRAVIDAADVVLVDEAGHDVLDALVGCIRPDRAVWCEVLCSPFAQPEQGLARHRTDLLLQAASGLLSTTGEPDRLPLRAGIDLSASIGALFATIGVLAALIGRDRTGCGQFVSVSLPDALTVSATNFASRVLAGEPPLSRLGNQGPNTAPWNLFQAKDGSYVYIAAGNDATFQRLCHVMGQDQLARQPELATEDLRRQHGPAVTAAVAEWMATQTGDGAVELLALAGVPARPVRSLRDVLAEERSSAGAMIRTVSDQHGAAWEVAANPLGLPSYSAARVDIPRSAAKGGRAPSGPITTFAGTATTAAARAESPGPPGDQQLGEHPPVNRPLAGVSVVELGIQTAGPYCCRILADLGADVVKVEPLRGEQGRRVPPLVDGVSAFFAIANAGKRGWAGELDQPADRARLAEDLRSADLLVSNLSGRWLAEHQLDAASLAAAYPDLVVVHISGFGADGPKRDLKAYDTVVQADAGVMSVTGYAGGAPMKTGVSSADFLGALGATAGALAAQYGVRRRLDTPRAVDLALYRVAVWATQTLWPWAQDRRAAVGRLGNHHWAHGPHGLYRCRDGLVAVSCERDREWARLCEVAVPQPFRQKLRSLSRRQRLQDRARVDDVVERFTAGRNVRAVVEAFAAAGLGAERVTTVEERLAPPRGCRSGLVTTVPGTQGHAVAVTTIPLRMSSGPLAPRGGAPALGSQKER